VASVHAFKDGWDAALVIFGLHLLVLGRLVLRSGYVPRTLGVLLMIASTGYVVDGLGRLLSRDYHANVTGFTFVGEVLLMAWLLWKETGANRGRARSPEPHRHIPYITDLDGPEAQTLGSVLARVTAALRAAVGAELTYAYIFGDRVPHLHVNLAPHTDGDALVGGPGLVRSDASEVPATRHQEVSAAVREQLQATPGGLPA
jgi:hypothetical protein